MTKEAVIAAGLVLFGELPPDIHAALRDVRIEVVKSPSDPEVLVLLDEEELDLEEPIIHNACGVYIGEQPEPTDDETDDAEPPVGLILLFADNLEDDERAKLTLAHEIGHALGMSEEEVEGLDLF